MNKIKQLTAHLRLMHQRGQIVTDSDDFNTALNQIDIASESQAPLDNKAVDDEAIKAMAEKEYPNASVGPLCGPLQREAYIKGVKDMINAITNPTKTKQPAKIAGH